jgi:hypothetical protein
LAFKLEVRETDTKRAATFVAALKGEEAFG